MKPQTQTHPDWSRRLTLGLLLLAAVLALAWLFLRGRPAAHLASTAPSQSAPQADTYNTPPQFATPFTATDQNGRPYTFAASKGKVTALFFGFTHCPDVCPVTLANLENARKRLPAAQQRDVQVVFVSLDPARDSPAQLKSYLSHFGPGITGLHVPESQLKNVAKAYGVLYKKGDPTSSGDYDVYHSSSTFLMDRDNNFTVLYAQLPDVPRVVSDLKAALAGN